MNHLSLSGRRIFVREARNRKDDKNSKVYESQRTVAGKDIEIVKGMEFDLAADLVRLEYSEFEHDVMKRHITKDVLNEWSFSGSNQSGGFYDSVFKDYSAELVTTNCGSGKEQEGITMLSYEILNEWNFEKKNKSDREVGVASEATMKLSGSLEINKSVCSSGVRIVDVMNGGFMIRSLTQKGRRNKRKRR
ncbi:hypothetical protein PIB30_006554 [Stylosanthes scabra]|uniref:Uncharacterized protein n=1 Tax=Stylosanthes scabra TaxID=79078 RepID=A0ABU6X4D2_9FABA|nr:hypothetical protein [Stylosanthes scabra]